jgi:hypothetical protein
MAGFFSKLFGKRTSTKKYEDVFMTARYRVGQSVEYAFTQAVDLAVREGAFSSRAEAAEKLYEVLLPKAEKEEKADAADLLKAKNKIK